MLHKVDEIQVDTPQYHIVFVQVRNHRQYLSSSNKSGRRGQVFVLHDVFKNRLALDMIRNAVDFIFILNYVDDLCDVSVI